MARPTPVIRNQNVLDFSMFRRAYFAMRRMFQGNRDLYKVFGYHAAAGYDDRYFKYLRQDIAARVVDAPAAALWTNPPLVTATDDLWNQMWDDLVARFNLYNVIERCDKLAGIGRYSLLLIGYNDGLSLDQPVNTRAISQKSEKILYLQPYSERTARIVQYTSNPRDSNFMKPSMYEISPMSEFVIGFDNTITAKDHPKGLNSTFKVHYSRIVHIAENCLENAIFGSPRMERVFNILDDLMKVTGGSAETYWLTANRGLHIDVDKEMELDPDDEKNLSDEVDEYVNNLRRIIRTRGTKVNSIGSEVADPTGVFNVLVSILSGATGIPRRILTGSEAGQLASDQDRANWADRIDERRADFGNPFVLFPLMKKLTQSGFLPTSNETEITVDWPTAFKLSPLENAMTSAQHARSATNFAKMFETMEKLKRGEPGTPGQTDPETGKAVPGTEVASIPGVDLGDLVTIYEARKMLGLDKEPVTFDSGADIGARVNAKGPGTKSHLRRVQIKSGNLMKFGL